MFHCEFLHCYFIILYNYQSLKRLPPVFTPTIPPIPAQTSVIASFAEPEKPPAVPANKYESTNITAKITSPQRTPAAKPFFRLRREATYPPTYAPTQSASEVSREITESDKSILVITKEKTRMQTNTAANPQTAEIRSVKAFAAALPNFLFVLIKLTSLKLYESRRGFMQKQRASRFITVRP
jgi:hypothetical protein